ncbi:protein involved in gliding motility SprE [Flavobacterium croceum DSM 17960]|uniref:Protein involved in gliding motility SprE n=1 Tax=Flavobacterium croceum DSM 17960 TaxID=1121886 RepID=A0A2S4NB41_9FLAO|nr:tetratricopeptide repeat protein [Flavobacterium croceum]POS02926.1 protein involved in gliding motility SprE [Flavobacterium croceum DSM 17960]
MKKDTIKYIAVSLVVTLIISCSTKKNTFLSRNSHALSTKYNILYNGGLALDKGITDLKSEYKDNFWEILPVERMLVKEENLNDEKQKNQNFERSEEKAVKAIQKHSMNIDGSEKNPQMDEAHLLLGKTRYYDQRFIPALEAFNYVLYKYPTSDKINEVKIWREKTNMRLENDELAIKNLNSLLKEIKVKDQIFADANATLAQAFINTKQNDSAVAKLRIASKFTKLDEEKARYNFIIGQLFDDLKQKDSALVAYQNVIDMKRSASKQYVIRAHAKQANYFDYKTQDTTLFLKKYQELLKDRENRPYIDVLEHQLGVFYDKQKKSQQAITHYNKSLKKGSQDKYLVASNYRNLAEIHFNNAKYLTAGKYYDSTLAVLNDKTREYKQIAKKRENLDDVIKFEGIAQKNDSILNLAYMNPTERDKYITQYIEKLKIEDNKKKEQEAKKALESTSKPTSVAPEMITSSTSSFYFYNAPTVAKGKIEFKKKWGDRPYVENWRWSKDIKQSTDNTVADNQNNTATETPNNAVADPKYTTNFYTKQIPTSKKVLDSLAKERNFAYYQLGVIYKEKFKEYPRAAQKLETLLDSNPEDRLILPTLYNLYKIYEIIDAEKAAALKMKITTKYPDSRYAQIINNQTLLSNFGSPEQVYTTLYNDYEKGLLRETFNKVNVAVEQYNGEEVLSKFELLKAYLTGRLQGLSDMKKALNFVALNYPNSEEGKETEKFIATRLPQLEALEFNTENPTSWKLVFEASLDSLKNKPLLAKLNKFLKDRATDKLYISTDVYTLDQDFIVLHGLTTKENALETAQILKDYKEYKLSNKAIIISSENYKVVQAKKNINDYITGDWITKEIKPMPKKVYIPTPEQQGNKANTKMVIPALKDKNELSKNQESLPMNPGFEREMNTGKPNGNNDRQPGNMTMPPSVTPKKP